MNNQEFTNLQLLREQEQKLKSQKIFFWIDGSDCYLLEWTIHYCNKIKIGDLSQTMENYFKKWGEKLDQLMKESEERDQFLNTKFSQISDLELIDEFQKRTQHQLIKLSMYSGNSSIFIEGKDLKQEGGITLPIEIQEKENE